MLHRCVLEFKKMQLIKLKYVINFISTHCIGPSERSTVSSFPLKIFPIKLDELFWKKYKKKSPIEYFLLY
jgi:hypothetical protein